MRFLYGIAGMPAFHHFTQVGRLPTNSSRSGQKSVTILWAGGRADAIAQSLPAPVIYIYLELDMFHSEFSVGAWEG